jgi:hypothetical protein
MWQPLLLLMLLGQAPAAPVARAPESTCVRCHRDLGDPFDVPVKASAHDIHFQNSLSCHSCHGGDPTKEKPEESMNRARGFIGQPPRKQIVALCASCHSNPDFMRKYNPQARVDEYSEYVTSVHGKKYLAGDPNVATCIDCHGNHGILAVKNPSSPVYVPNVAATCGRCHSDPKRMASYGIATDQQELYTKSVHGIALMKQRDLSAPTCNSCHGNHGAAPPGVDAVANVCGQCHVNQWNLFNQSPHQKAFAANKWPGCVTCHQNHEILHPTDSMLGVSDPALCGTCHPQGTAGYTAAQKMKANIVGLAGKLAAATDVLERAQRAGMEVSRPIFQLSEGRDRLVLARVQVHKFDPALVQNTVAEGGKIAAASDQSGWQALQDLAYRRKGMAVSAVILLCMIGLLLIKIRRRKDFA